MTALNAVDRRSDAPTGIDLLRRRGLLMLTVARDWGGEDAGLARAREVIEALARCDPSAARMLSMHAVQTRLLSDPGCRWPRATRARVLHSVVRRGALLSGLHAEPMVGSPRPGGLPATIARRSATGWRLSGRKVHSADIGPARWCIVWARTDETDPRVGSFLVAREAPGVHVARTRDGLGFDVVFDDVALPLEHAVDVRPAGSWLRAPDGLEQLWTRVLLGAARARPQRLLRWRPSDLGSERAVWHLAVPAGWRGTT